MESGIHDVESRIQDRLGSPYMGRQTTGVTWLTCTKRFSIGLVKRASYTLISFVTVICIFEIFNVNSVSSLNEPFRLLEQIVLINIVYKKKRIK